ncbi:MAG: 1-deoxy-D-xylulose-5-phosphate synthase [Eubacteriales bacterium]
MVLKKINEPNDIKKLNEKELEKLPSAIREFLVKSISKTGGHLASNLGVVELTMALHLSLDLPKDKIIWDVGHQAYTHKILTGRKDGFDELRKYGGMSGFPKRKESACDAFDTGHSSTSISAGLGYVRGRDIQGENYRVVSVIGDGALTGGMAYEALNNAATLHKNFIIILNDNNMSISPNVGGMSRYLAGIRTATVYTGMKQGVETTLKKIPVAGEKIVRNIRKTKSSIKQLFVPGMFFEDMGITYLGPVDGHDLKLLRKTMSEAKKVQGAVLIHVLTTKGKGYKPAEAEPSKFHGTGPFEIMTGKAISNASQESYTDVFGRVLSEEARKNKNIVAITAAMADGTGLAEFGEKYPKRFFDVGIAEEHGVTFAAGLAASGMIPVIALYSSFLQRAYDQIIHDVCLQNLPVVFAVDRAGLVGNDGETHQGVFDISFLSNIPNITILAPKNKWELEMMVPYAVGLKQPVAIRYPRGMASIGFESFSSEIKYGQSEVLYEEEQIAIVAVGHMMDLAAEVRTLLKETGYACSLVNARFIKPVDEEMLELLAVGHKIVVTIEENIIAGGYGQAVRDAVQKRKLGLHVLTLGIDDEYVEHGGIDELRREVLLDKESITKRIISEYVML